MFTAFISVGVLVEQNRLLARALTPQRKQEGAFQAPRTVIDLSDANRVLGLEEEGTQQAEESFVNTCSDRMNKSDNGLEFFGHMLLQVHNPPPRHRVSR